MAGPYPNAPTGATTPLSSSPIVLCCADDNIADVSPLVAQLRDLGCRVELVSGVDLDSGLLIAAIGRHGPIAVYVLCRSVELDAYQVGNLTEELQARGIDPSRMIEVNVGEPVGPAVARIRATAAARPASGRTLMLLPRPVRPAPPPPPTRATQPAQPRAPAMPPAPTMPPPPAIPPAPRVFVNAAPTTETPTRVTTSEMLTSESEPVTDPALDEPFPTFEMAIVRWTKRLSTIQGITKLVEPTKRMATEAFRRATQSRAKLAGTIGTIVGGGIIIVTTAAVVCSPTEAEQSASKEVPTLAASQAKGTHAEPTREREPRAVAADAGPPAQATVVTSAATAAPRPSSERTGKPAGPDVSPTEALTVPEEEPADGLAALATEVKLIYEGLAARKIRSLDIVLFVPEMTKQMRYAQAEQYCATKNVDGVSGWRLPTIGELGSLASAGMIHRRSFFWSSTPADTYGTQHLSMMVRSKRIYPRSARWKGARVVCVREAPPEQAGSPTDAE